jgi:hypothetical protein
MVHGYTRRLLAVLSSPQTRLAGQLLGSLTRSLWCRRRRSAPSWGLGGQLAVAGQLLARALRLHAAIAGGSLLRQTHLAAAAPPQTHLAAAPLRRRLAMCCPPALPMATDGDACSPRLVPAQAMCCPPALPMATDGGACSPRLVPVQAMCCPPALPTATPPPLRFCRRCGQLP